MTESVFVRGILDRPSPESLGMLGLIVARRDGTLQTESVIGSQSGRVEIDEFGNLLESGAAFRVDMAMETEKTPYAALWVGKRFNEESSGVGLSLPPLPAQNSSSNNEGTFWIAPRTHIWRVIDSWTLRAFRRVVVEPDRRIARLMTWALPNKPETRAARWLTARGEAAKDKELDWTTRLERDSGVPTITRESLRASYLDLIEHARRTDQVRVVGFSALAAGGDGDIAKFVASKQNLPRVSFGRWLRKKAINQGERRPDRRFLQKLGQEMIDNNGELALLLDVLESSHLRPAQPFVIEGIRHRKILESIRTLVGEDLFYYAFVERSEQERLQLLHDNEHLSDSDVQLVLNDATEVEIPDLKREADIELDRERGVETEGTRLIHELVTA